MTTGEASPLPDEDTLTIPVGWRRSMLPRRGGTPGPALPKVDAAPGELVELITSIRADLDEILANEYSDPALVAAARGYLAGTDCSTAEAAAVAATAATAVPYRQADRLRTFADAWVATGGLAYAAGATIELADMGAWGSSVRRQRAASLERGHRALHWDLIAYRVRAHLAAARNDDYQKAVATLTRYRTGTPGQRVATSFLVPSETRWVRSDIDAYHADQSGDPTLLLLAAGDAADANNLATVLAPWETHRLLTQLATVIDGVGAGFLPTLVTWYDHQHLVAAGKQRVAAAIALLPTDDAMRALVDRATDKYAQAGLLAAAERFPVRATRLLAHAADDSTAAAKVVAPLLRAHVLAHPEAAAAAAEQVTDQVHTRIGAVEANGAVMPEATAGDIPPALITPPWLAPRPAAIPIVVAGLLRADESELRFLDGEREEWITTESDWTANWRDDPRSRWETRAAALAANTLNDHEAIALLAGGPMDLATPLVQGWRPRDSWGAKSWMRILIGRHGMRAYPLAMQLATDSRANAAGLLAPFATTEVADLMTGWLGRKNLREAAVAWFRRHPDVGSRAAIPAALGRPGVKRRAAEETLRVLAADHPDTVLACAEAYGPDAGAAVRHLLTHQPVPALPTKPPPLPTWCNPGLLPPVHLRGRSSVLPGQAVTTLLTMLALNTLARPLTDLRDVVDACDPASLAEFGWSLFEAWRAVGSPAKGTWALGALGVLGDDDTIRRLTPLVRAWPGEGGHARAVAALDVFTSIGTEVALMHLASIAQRMKFAALKAQAAAKIADIALSLGLTAEQLNDRLIPDLGLDPDGTMTLDYGARRFTVGFDERLKPYVADGTGRRSTLPKPGTRDDSAKATIAFQSFANLKKDARMLAADQITRFELGMVTSRRWSVDDFIRLLVGHPLVSHIVRRLVWCAYDESGSGTFRVTEDRTFANVTNVEISLPGDATVGIAHPLTLGDESTAWSELFADHVILQPFPQLGRACYHLTDGEAAGASLARFDGTTVPTGRVMSLERRGWRRAAPQDAGVQPWMYRTLPDGGSVVISLDPGIAVGSPMEYSDQQTLESIWLSHHADGEWHRTRNRVFGELDSVTASELLRDLIEITSP